MISDLVYRAKTKILTSVRMLDIRFRKQDKNKIIDGVRILDIRLRTKQNIRLIKNILCQILSDLK